MNAVLACPELIFLLSCKKPREPVASFNEMIERKFWKLVESCCWKERVAMNLTSRESNGTGEKSGSNRTMQIVKIVHMRASKSVVRKQPPTRN
jgi:hypothetical protein